MRRLFQARFFPCYGWSVSEILFLAARAFMRARMQGPAGLCCRLAAARRPQDEVLFHRAADLLIAAR